MVSAAYAKLNGLQVGDTLTLDFYNAGYAKENSSNGNAFNAELFHTLSSFPLLPENRMDLTQDYEIVGIYTGPEFALGGHNFYADTIFVPKQSVPHAESFEDSTLPLLTSLVLENGAEEKFEDYMKRQGMEDAFVCFDQGYAETPLNGSQPDLAGAPVDIDQTVRSSPFPATSARPMSWKAWRKRPSRPAHPSCTFWI